MDWRSLNFVLYSGIFVLMFTHHGSEVLSAMLKFTNIKCLAMDKAFADFRHCELKVPNRGVIALNLHVELYQLPVNNVSINLSLFKKASGYRPFLYNYSTDFCRFMTNRKQQPFLDIFFAILLKESNINHTCPYNHDIIIKNLVLIDEHIRLVPFPTGEYLFQLKVAAYNHWKAEVKAYIAVRE